jgi:hypothetical protein
MVRRGSHRRGSLPLAVLIVLLLVMASACSGGDDGPPGQGAADTSSQAPVPAHAIWMAGEVVVLTDSGDEKGIPGATVVMRPQRGGKERRFGTDRYGNFSNGRHGILPGTYEVSVEGLQRGQTFTPIEFTVSGTSYNVFVPRLVVTD